MTSDSFPSSAARTGQPAIFLDRDGTLIEDVGYLSDPNDIRIMPGVVEGLTRLKTSGFALVIVTNQSAVGRGMITEGQLERIHDEMVQLFEVHRIRFDAIYFCPEVPLSGSEEEIEYEDRKPGPGMLRRAAREHGLDLASSWMIGDKRSDVLAGFNAGCRSILIGNGQGRLLTSIKGDPRIEDYPIADNLATAAELILSSKPLIIG